MVLMILTPRGESPKKIAMKPNKKVKTQKKSSNSSINYLMILKWLKCQTKNSEV
jgi:hypothetical protein